MKITIFTAFPELVESGLNHSIIRRASESGQVKYRVINLRRYTTDLHRTIDDIQFGGGYGMVLKPEPFFRAMDALKAEETGKDLHVIYTSPRGRRFDQKRAEELGRYAHLVFFCGHYKGVDERVREKLVNEEISIGDYIVSGGELPTLLIIDSIVRLLPGVLTHTESAETDSFMDDLLEEPIYTRPATYRNMSVPEILLSGHHQKIKEWRKKQRLEITRKYRNDLFENRHGED